ASNVLKPALARGEIQCIGATTLDEYRKYIEKDGALERRFQQIIVNTPTKTEAVKILKGLPDRYQEHPHVVNQDGDVESAVGVQAAWRVRWSCRIATSAAGACRTRPSTSSTRPGPGSGSRP